MATTQGIKLDDNTQARLKALGEIRDRSPHWLMKTAIESYLKREEKYEIEKAEDATEYEDYLLSGKAIDNSTVLSWLDDLTHNKNTPWPK
ncbi:MAG: toxin-antitoxin system [Candidatus Saccharibacteria bacterium]